MDAQTALTNPQSVIQAIYLSSSSLEGLDQRVSSHFSSLFSTPGAITQIPSLSSLIASGNLPLGRLVRFRAMVQDTGLGSEVYKVVGSKRELLAYGLEELASSEITNSADDYSNLGERQIFYIVNVPGETAWAKKALDSGADLPQSLETLSITNGASSTGPHLANKFPVPSESNFGCIAKVYGVLADRIKTTEVLDFVGVLSETTFSSSFDDLSKNDHPPVTTSVAALHVLFAVAPENTPAASTPVADVVDLRKELIEYLASSVAGDVDAAEWVLLAVLGHIHTRHATGMTLGSLSLNLAIPEDVVVSVYSVLSTLLPTVTSIPLSIPFLNDVKTSLAPRNRDDNLESGALQLSNGTTVVVDTRGIGEGKLEDLGVRNLRHIATTVAQQKLSYQFPFSSFELETDLDFIILSVGKAIIPTDCVVYVSPATDFKPPATPTPAKFSAFRSFLITMKTANCTIPVGMSEVIQEDFVKRRRESVGGEAMTQEDLLFRMNAARLLTLSHGQTELNENSWVKMAELDERRKQRSPSRKMT